MSSGRKGNGEVRGKRRDEENVNWKSKKNTKNWYTGVNEKVALGGFGESDRERREASRESGGAETRERPVSIDLFSTAGFRNDVCAVEE